MTVGWAYAGLSAATRTRAEAAMAHQWAPPTEDERSQRKVPGTQVPRIRGERGGGKSAGGSSFYAIGPFLLEDPCQPMEHQLQVFNICPTVETLCQKK